MRCRLKFVLGEFVLERFLVLEFVSSVVMAGWAPASMQKATATYPQPALHSIAHASTELYRTVRLSLRTRKRNPCAFCLYTFYRRKLCFMPPFESVRGLHKCRTMRTMFQPLRPMCCNVLAAVCDSFVKPVVGPVTRDRWQCSLPGGVVHATICGR